MPLIHRDYPLLPLLQHIIQLPVFCVQIALLSIVEGLGDPSLFKVAEQWTDGSDLRSAVLVDQALHEVFQFD